MTNDENGLIALRDAVLALKYREMMQLAQWFADTDKDDISRLGDADFWAYVIGDWAENSEITE